MRKGIGVSSKDFQAYHEKTFFTSPSNSDIHINLFN